MGLRTAKFKIKQLDRRHSGYDLFSHRIEVYWNEDFLKIRHWMVESLGPACELDLFQLSQHLELGYTWAWDTRDYKRILYVNQEQLSCFLLYNT